MENPLPSWNDTPTKQTILDFLAAVTDEAGRQYVPPAERIAVFDNDGTLWCEKPMYIQFDYILRKLAAQAESDASLRAKQPWKAAWEKDFDWLGGVITKHYQGDDSEFKVFLGGILSLAEGQAVEQIEEAARNFIENERHPTLGNGFTNYIVSGGGRDFMRGFAQDLYGIPRERVIGSTVAYSYVESDDGGEIVQQAELDVIDDGPGKPIQIWNVIGRRPILAAGNSNGDLPMLAFTGGASLPALRLLVVHDDTDREFDYLAGAEKAINAAQAHNWITVSIKNEWREVFPI